MAGKPAGRDGGLLGRAAYHLMGLTPKGDAKPGVSERPSHPMGEDADPLKYATPDDPYRYVQRDRLLGVLPPDVTALLEERDRRTIDKFIADRTSVPADEAKLALDRMLLSAMARSPALVEHIRNVNRRREAERRKGAREA